MESTQTESKVDNSADIKLLKVKGDTNVKALAGSIFSAYEETPTRPVTVRAVGAGALNQAVKSIIVANKQFVKKGLIATILPTFQSFGENLTAVELQLRINKI